MSEIWRVEMLGGLRARWHDRCIERFRTRQVAALLAYLSYWPGRAFERDAVAEMLWPGADPEKQRQYLRQALFYLRRHLDIAATAPSIIESDFTGIRIRSESVLTDVAAFVETISDSESSVEKLRRAVDLYVGPLLPHLDEPWIEPERQRLRDLYFGGLKRLIRALAESKEYELAIEYAHRAVREDPYREDGHRALMRLYVAVGRPAAARDQFSELTRLLAELEQSPSVETRGFAERSPDTPLRPAATATTTAPPAPKSARAPLITAPPARLPRPLTSLFGRAHDIESIVRALAGDTRLVTLTGPGGVGKTRLSLEVAHAMVESLEDAVYFVPLADLRDPAAVPDRILSALPVERAPNEPELDQAARFLSRRPGLLVLDNLEQLMPGGRAAVLALRSQAPNLRILASSRVRVRAAGEVEHKVSLLAVPPASGEPESPSVDLFVDRACSARSEFRLTEHNRETVAAICRRLEGLPLAIELAAARIGTLTPAQILAGLEERFRILSTVHTDKSDRHRSLWAAIDWSYDLLPADLQQFFTRLSVFRGGWTAESAAAVASDDPDAADSERAAMDLLERLRNHSLIEDEERNGLLRFRMLESIREFASDQVPVENRNQLSRSHCEYCILLAESMEPLLHGPKQFTILDRLTSEHYNFRSALDWSLREAPESALRLSGALYWFWHMRSHLREGRHWLESALNATEPTLTTPERAKALQGSGQLAFYEQDRVFAKSRLLQCGEIYSRLDDLRGYADSLIYLAFAAEDLPDDQMYGLLHRALGVFRKLSDDWGVAMTTFGLGGQLTLGRDAPPDHAAAEPHLKESIRLFRALGDRWGLSGSLYYFAMILMAKDRLAEAQELLKEVIEIHRETGDAYRLALALERSGEIALRIGDLQLATERFQAALERRRLLGDPASIGVTTIALGLALMGAGEGANGIQTICEGVRTCGEADDLQGAAVGLECLAVAAHRHGDPVFAARLLGAATGCRVSKPLRTSHFAPLVSAEDIAAIRSSPGETSCEETVAEGPTEGWRVALGNALRVWCSPSNRASQR